MKSSTTTYTQCALFLLSLFVGINSFADNQPLKATLSNKQIVEKMFQVFADTHSNLTNFSNYLSSNYIQNADGHTINYQGFLAHVQGLHSAMKSIHFTFEQIVAEGDIVATHHIANGIKKNGQRVKTEFFSFFTVKNHKITECQEVSRMIEGTSEDQDLSYH